MKGTLIKNKNSEWLVKYTDKSLIAETFVECEIPLHPEDIKKYNEYLFNGEEVEFEIVGDIKDLIENGKSTIKYAKITEGSFGKEGNAITRGYVEPTESFNMMMKDYEPESWNNVEKEYHNYSWEEGENKRFPMEYSDWLKEHYLAPIKKQ